MFIYTFMHVKHMIECELHAQSDLGFCHAGERDMYEKYETSYFCKLWRSVEACNLIALDFNGDFVLYVHCIPFRVCSFAMFLSCVQCNDGVEASHVLNSYMYVCVFHTCGTFVSTTRVSRCLWDVTAAAVEMAQWNVAGCTWSMLAVHPAKLKRVKGGHFQSTSSCMRDCDLGLKVNLWLRQPQEHLHLVTSFVVGCACLTPAPLYYFFCCALLQVVCCSP